MAFKPKDGRNIRWWFDDYSYWGKPLEYLGDKEEFDSLIANFIEAAFLANTPKTQGAIKSILLNLCFVHGVSEGRACLDILLGDEKTGTQSYQYRVYGCAHTLLAKIVHSFNNHGLIEHKRGRPAYEPSGGKKGTAHSTKIRLSGPGIQRINGRVDISKIISRLEPVLCKGLSKKLNVPTHSITAKTQYKLIDKYNGLLNNSIISICGHPIYNMEKSVFRLFADKSCKFDGRLYGAFHQRISKELRRGILINGEETVEVDIKSTHPLIIYAIAGMDITEPQKGFRPKSTTYAGDPYSVVGMYGHSKADRNINKSLFTRMLNFKPKDDESDEDFAGRVEGGLLNAIRIDKRSNSKKKAIQALEMEKAIKSYRRLYLIESGVEFGISDIVLGLLDRHKAIRKWFASEAWKRLNKFESDILLRVVKHFTYKNIPVLTIHDSARIAAQYEEELVSLYKDAIEDVLKFKFCDRNKLVSVDHKFCELGDDKFMAELRMFRHSNKLVSDFYKIPAVSLDI